MNKEIIKILGVPGSMISGSKSGYRNNNPNNLAIFNSNICTIDGEEFEKIWFGDIDLTLSSKNLINLSKILNKTIVVLHEMDGRFENEVKPLIHKYVYKVDPDGTESLGNGYERHFEIINGIIKSK